MDSILRSDYVQGWLGNAGGAGLYNAFYSTFTAFALISLPLCILQDAPFGRVVLKKGYRICVNGTIGWLVMEIVSPMSFIAGLAQKNPSTGVIPKFSSILSYYSVFRDALSTLPMARKVLASMYLIHYFNRAIISSFRNPGRAKMSISVPLSAIVFNTINGILMGKFIGSPTSTSSPDGLLPGSAIRFYGCMGVFVLGLIVNIYSDEVLYALRRNRLRSPKSTTESPAECCGIPQSHKERYGIPQGFLYSYPFSGIAFPNYFSEWVEWSAFYFASTLLLPSSLPYIADKRITPPALFVLLLLGVMGPRAVSGDRWYRDTFGKEYPKERRIVIPGLF